MISVKSQSVSVNCYGKWWKNRKDISENHHGLANFSLILVRSRNLSIEWHTVFAYITGSTLGTVCITSPTSHSLLIVLWTRNVRSGWWLTFHMNTIFLWTQGSQGKEAVTFQPSKYLRNDLSDIGENRLSQQKSFCL